jgi:hypothetical protein
MKRYRTLWTILTNPADPANLLRQGWKAVSSRL